MTSETGDDGGGLGAILRAQLRESLDRDVQRRFQSRAGRAGYADWWAPGDRVTALKADFDIIRTTKKAEFDRAIAENRPNDLIEDWADVIIRESKIPREPPAMRSYTA